MKKKFVKTAFLFVALSLTIFGNTNFPKKNVELIVPYSAGGGTDQVGRFAANAAQKYLKKPIIVVNKTGAGGAIGHVSGAKSRPDGHTLTVVTVELTTLPHLGGMQLTYEDFIPIVRLNATPSAITVKADSPFNTIEDFVKYAKENPGAIRVGNSGVGAIWHLGAAAFEDKANIKLNHIPFDGAAPAVASLLGGHIEAVAVSPAEVQSQLEAGNLKMLGVMSAERIKGFENIPTLKEQGYDVEVGTWRGIAVPKKTPKEVVAILEDAFIKGTQDSEYLELMAKAGLTTDVLNSEDFQVLLENDNKEFKMLIEKLNLRN